MNKKLLWGIIAILWFFVATWLYNKYSPCCKCKAECCAITPPAVNNVPLSLTDNDWSYSCNDNFKFGIVKIV